MIGAHSGLGFLTLNSQEVFQIPSMYAGILLLAVVGFAAQLFAGLAGTALYLLAPRLAPRWLVVGSSGGWRCVAVTAMAIGTG